VSKTVEVTFTGVESARRLQNSADEKHKIVRHTFDVKAGNIAADVLLTLDGPNPRTPNVRKKAAKQLKDSLIGADPSTVGAFHLAHAGVRGVVKSLKRVDDSTYKAVFEVETGTKSEDHGIANGLHTIAVIRDALKGGEIPSEQYVTFTLIENIPRELVPYVGEGLNTNIQVAEESIINLGGAFEPFKVAIKGASYFRNIGWHENEPGEYDARDVFAILNALNVVLYPNDEKDRHPIESYEKQSRCIAAFHDEVKDKENSGKDGSFEAMIPILKDALFLYDTIRSDAYDRYKHAVPGGKPGRLAIMEARYGNDGNAKPEVWTFPFISDGKSTPERGTYRLAKGVTFAMLAALRNFVQYDAKRNRMSWIGGFKAVREAWTENGGEMMMAANDVSQAVNYNPNAVGKNRPLWRQLHQMVASYQLQIEADTLRNEIAAMKAVSKK
jgi:AIPR protein